MSLDFDVFKGLLEMLLVAYGKRDENGNLTIAYYDSIKRVDPTEDEVWEAMSQFIDRRGDHLPDGSVGVKSGARQF